MAKKYIEADSIMQACYDKYLKIDNKAYADIIALIFVAPAADVQEVRHGYWIQMGYIEHTFLVSECSVRRSL